MVSSFNSCCSYSLLVPFSSHREAQEKPESAKHCAERPKIQQQFAGLKKGLSSATDENGKMY